MLLIPPITTRALAIPASSNLSLIPPPLPPSPPGLSDDKSGDEGEDGDHDEEHTPSGPLQPNTPNTAAISSVTFSSSSSTLLKSTVSITSSGLVVSSSSSSSTTSETSFTDQTTLSTSITSSTSQSSTPSSLSQSNNNETTSTLISSTLSAPSTSIFTSSHSSTGTALPIGQPDSSPHETTSNSSPISTAGIVLAAIFGFIALLTTICLLYRFCHRRNKSSSGPYSEKQNTYTPTAQDTGVIFGRRSGLRTSSNPYGQDDQRARGQGRSRFSFLNRRWYSTGTQFSGSQQEHGQQQAGQRQSHLDTTSTTPFPAPSHWPSPLFFMPNRHQHRNHLPNPFTNAQSYPQTPRTTTTITRLTNDILINRNISTHTTGTSGSGHARAYAHHGVRAPHSLVIDVARNTISSISSRWSRGRTRTRQRNSRVSSMASRVRDRATERDAENVGSPVSEISDLYNARTYGDRDHSSPYLSFTPRIHRLSNSTSNSNSGSDFPSGDRSTSKQLVASGRWRSSQNRLGDSTTAKTKRLGSDNSDPYSPSHARRSRARFTDMPRLPLPVAVSRGSWGSKIDVGV